MFRIPLLLVAACLITCTPLAVSWAAEVSVQTDAESGFEIYTISQDVTQVKLAPEAGANVFSIRIGGVEFLRQPDSLSSLPGVGFGNPVLYPTPNRVKGAAFTFDGNEYRFKANAGGNFIHGLVHSTQWKVIHSKSEDDHATVECEIDFSEGSQIYERFPFTHRIRLSILVRSRSVLWRYTVDNSEGTRAVPFGFALHPYFVYQGAREHTFLTIPATHWMEAKQQLPSGRLIPAEQSPHPLAKAVSMGELKLDDVFFGMQPQSPTKIDFRDVKRQIKIHASEDFTHLVVWTPDRPYFGVESQTCSTDAHNLYAQGLKKESHLQVCPAGGTLMGSVEYRFVLP